MKPSISIIVPVYNVERYLKRCMDSLLNQTMRNIEIILVDDESPDNCPLLCEEYARIDNRVKVVHKKNGGLGFARNSGLKYATGEYVAFVDSDDFVSTSMYETLLDKAMSDNLDVCFSNTYTYGPGGSCFERNDVEQYETFVGREMVDNFFLDMIGTLPECKYDMKYLVTVWHAVYKRELIEKYNISFLSERDVQSSEDIFFHFSFLQKAERVGYIPRNFYYYCQNGEYTLSNFSFERYLKVIDADKRLYQQLNNTFRDDVFILHFQRKCFLRLRAFIMSIACSNNSFLNRYKMINKILNGSYYVTQLVGYPFELFPIKQKIVFFMFKYKMVLLSFLIMKILNNKTFKSVGLIR